MPFQFLFCLGNSSRLISFIFTDQCLVLFSCNKLFIVCFQGHSSPSKWICSRNKWSCHTISNCFLVRTSWRHCGELVDFRSIFISNLWCRSWLLLVSIKISWWHARSLHFCPTRNSTPCFQTEGIGPPDRWYLSPCWLLREVHYILLSTSAEVWNIGCNE